MKFTNPIIPGMNPDPSICRVGDDYYMVCSSMELYPGIPIFHSTDLAHWEQIGNVMSSENGFHQKANTLTGGVMAPTIRFHDGTFYVLDANFSDKGNFYVTAKNPAGPWSAPHWMSDVPGIDASLFFDDDGTGYICGTGDITDPHTGIVERGIWMAKYDFEQGKRLTEPQPIWNSALRGASSPEAPHLYHIGDWYYLMIAEGGTEYWHSVTIARSRTIDGWYEGNPANPIMTHRNLGLLAPISNVGHADLVETADGKWFAVLLGSRTIEGNHKNIGRETFICPVSWQLDWPIFAPLVGQVSWQFEVEQSPSQHSEIISDDEFQPVDDTGVSTLPHGDIVTDFSAGKLPLRMVLWGTPYGKVYDLSRGKLSLTCLARAIDEKPHSVLDSDFNARRDDCVAFVGCRQISVDFQMDTCMSFTATHAETAGIVIAQSLTNQYRVEKYCAEDSSQHIRLVRTVTQVRSMPHMPNFQAESVTSVLADCKYEQESLYLRMNVHGQTYRFFIGPDQSSLSQFGSDQDGVLINPDLVSGTGSLGCTVVGMFASGNGVESENQATFDFFSYRVTATDFRRG